MSFEAWRSVMAALIFAICAALASMAYATRIAHDSIRQWCDVVTTLHESYRDTPPQTPTGRRLAADIAELRARFDCPQP